MRSLGSAWLAAMALAVGAVVLVVADAWLVTTNQAAQAEVTRRQDYIAQTAQLARVNQAVATALAEAAQRDDNEALRTMLTKNGITFRPTAAPAPVPPPTPGSQP